jgi:hypothetical protein
MDRTSNTCRPWLLATAAGLAFSTSALAQVNNPEVEPNEVKGTATVAASGGGGMANMDFITGNSTGSSTSTAGAASADTFRVKTAGAALGIYRHRLQITTTGTSGHGGTIRGLSQGSTGIGTGDNTFQSSSTLTTPTRFNQWYGFGKGEEIYYRVTGTGSTTSDYVSTLETTPVALSSDILSGVEAGAVTVTSVGQGHTTDTEVWVYDSNLDAIPGFGNDDEFGTTSTQSKVTRTMAAGTYYVAITNFAFANNQASPSDDDFRTGTVLDFPNAAANSSTSTGVNVAFAFISPVGTLAVAGTRAGPYDINWVRFAVSPAVTPTNPTITATTATPSSADNCGTANIVVTATVSPGAAPPSTGLAVSVDASAVLGGTVNLLDNGVAPDATAGDNVFSGTVTVGAGATVGTQALTFNAVDAELRSATPVNRNVTVTLCPPPPPGCPAGDIVFTLPSMNSFGLQGDAGNSISVQNTASTATVDKIRFSGRHAEVNTATLFSEARIRVTAPDGTVYTYGGTGATFTTTTPGTDLRDVTSNEFNLPGGEVATGNWSFETHEGDTAGADDTGLDAIWNPLCVSLVAVTAPTNPIITATTASPTSGDNCGSTNIVVTATVAGGLNPPSTGLVVQCDATAISGLLTTLLDNGVAPDATAADGIYSGTVTIGAGAPVGSQNIIFLAQDAELRSATPVNRAITVVACPPPAPSCPAGDVVFSLPAMNSAGPVGDVGNSISVQNTASTQTITKIRFTGRQTEQNLATVPSEARLRVTAPDGTIYSYGPFTFSYTVSPIHDVTVFEAVLTGGEVATGNWTFETFESFDDSGLDAIWNPACVALVADAIPPSITNDSETVFGGPSLPIGDEFADISMTVTPGFNPTAAITSVTIDGTAAGLGTIVLTDPELDNVWTATVDCTGVAGGQYVLPATVTDALARTGTSNLTLTVQPGVVDLGIIGGLNVGTLVDNAPQTFTGQVSWYAFRVRKPGANPIDLTFMDVTSNGSVLNSTTFTNDTEIGVYTDAGALVASNDDEGTLASSALSFGFASGNALGGTGFGDTAPFLGDGLDGNLAPGQYYIAISGFSTTHGATNFGVASTSSWTGTLDLNFFSNLSRCNSIDFNGDSIFPDNQDIIDFIDVFAGGTCPTGTCDDIDFNGDGVFPDNQDIIDYINVFAGGSCPT